MVSVNEMEGTSEVPKDILGAIFEKQRELANKYVEIEEMGDLLDKTKTNLDTLEGQIWLKDFLYRTIEEVGESFEVVRNHSHWDFVEDVNRIHYSEELIDALHFFVELCIIAGIEREEFKDISKYGHVDMLEIGLTNNSFSIRHWEIVEALTLAGNKLRNKKWKKTHVLTDRKIFFDYLEEAFDRLIGCLRAVGLNDVDIYNLYFKKNKVNQFRQRSNY